MITELERFYRIDRPPTDRPWVVVSMIATVDGATASGGVSGPLGNATDQQVLRLVRGQADVILVGASTVRVERYRPVRPPKRLVVVSRSGRLDEVPELVAAPNTEVVRPDPGAAAVDLAAVVAECRGRVVVSEGGPTLNGQLLAAGLVDEVFLTVSPMLLGGDSARVVHGPEEAHPEPWELRHVLHDEGYLFLRYRSRRSSSASDRSSGTSS